MVLGYTVTRKLIPHFTNTVKFVLVDTSTSLSSVIEPDEPQDVGVPIPSHIGSQPLAMRIGS